MQGMLHKEEEKEFNVEKFAQEVDQEEEDYEPQLGQKTKSQSTHKSEKRTQLRTENIVGKTVQNGDIQFDLTVKKKVQVRSYRKQLMVDLREFYMNEEGEMKPTKKGFCFTKEQWESFKDLIPAIDEALQKKEKK